MAELRRDGRAVALMHIWRVEMLWEVEWHAVNGGFPLGSALLGQAEKQLYLYTVVMVFHSIPFNFTNVT